jgi:hypothetical protein
VPLSRLKFRCSNCGSDRTDFVVTSAAVVSGGPAPLGQGANSTSLSALTPRRGEGASGASQGGVAGGMS